LIHNVYELQNISNDLSGHYALANDINATITRMWNGGKGFIPIGTDANPFTGVLDGRGHKIINLYINEPASREYVGLFGEIYWHGKVENLSLINEYVRGATVLGGVAGDNFGTIKKIKVSGEIYGKEYVGGVVGINSVYVRDCQFSGTVRAQNFTGGLAGINIVTVNNTHSSGTVQGVNFTGGLVGFNSGHIINSYTTSNITGRIYTGALSGYNGEGHLINSYYDMYTVLINGIHSLTVGGIYDDQYRRWLSNGLHLNISDYSSTLSPAGKYYEISSVQGLKDMLGFSEYNFSFRLTANLSLSSEPNFYIPYFSGVFDGNNHTISDVYINKSLEGNIGLFGFNAGTVKNLGVVNENISGNLSVGGLAGSNEGLVYGSYTTGKVAGYYNVGGLVGTDHAGDVSINILKSCSISTVIGKLNVGGLVGDNYGLIESSYSGSMVEGGIYVGGFVGTNEGIVTNSYAIGYATGHDVVGGFAGVNEGTIEYVYSTGKAKASPYYYSGGLVASNIGNITASFWDLNSSGEVWSDGGIGKTTAEMKNKTTFTSAGWDFENIWTIKDGKTYPYLKWQAPSSAFTEKKLYAGCH
jgi:hypothetical protein